MSAPITRRSFLQTSAAATFLAGAPAYVRGRDLNSKIDVAVVGCGGRGGSNLAEISRTEYITALCDVNGDNLGKAAEKHKDARTFTDFRKLFDSPKAFDAVVVSTCEHTHVYPTLLALKEKKHVYCEKPLTHNIYEARLVREAAAKANVTTQMGIQIHANEAYRRTVELIQAGVIGAVKEVHVWVSRAWGLQSAEAAKKHGDIVYVTERPTKADPIPKTLDWELWLGPASERPFSNVYFPGPKWYRWWDFGNGTMSDLGSHRNDLPFWALKLKAPLTIEADGPKPHAELAPATMSATYTYGARGDLPPVTLTWYQGEMKPKIWSEGGIPKAGDGVLFVGEKGMLLADYASFKLLPEDRFRDAKLPEPTLPRVKSHHQEWLDAIKEGKKSSCDFEYSGWLTEANHLGNVAYRVDKKLEWDAEKMKATNAPEADAFIKRSYRKGWEL
jgi:predicted dehydrogenase